MQLLVNCDKLLVATGLDGVDGGDFADLGADTEKGPECGDFIKIWDKR
ncbi:unnamed protein product [Protopolystoma xenopodis]|uniref:Uncharacterized protein n=1 Tax=Protopolystoma xenopodis TaxID=117903 RepID=A0A448WLG4_9PLAT|nr:unnamed protein product [Protopolystoma xenopodis]